MDTHVNAAVGKDILQRKPAQRSLSTAINASAEVTTALSVSLSLWLPHPQKIAL